jgi:hypothetical protein
LKEPDEVEAIGLMDKSLLNLPEDPERNLDFEAHGRKRAAVGCVVTVAILTDLNQ